MNKIILLASILLLSAFAEEVFYTFQQEWSQTLCQFNECQKTWEGNFKGNTFTMHGLWPDTDTGATKCQFNSQCTKNIQFDSSLLSSTLAAELDTFWVGFYNETDTFRAHEYNKHGTCWPTPASAQVQIGVSQKTHENNYFSQVYNLWKQYQWLDVLSQAGVVPNDNETYSSSQIIQIIANYIGLTPADVEMDCKKDKSGNAYLNSISICLDQNYKPRTCLCGTSRASRTRLLDYPATTCPSDIVFPVNKVAQ